MIKKHICPWYLPGFKPTNDLPGEEPTSIHWIVLTFGWPNICIIYHWNSGHFTTSENEWNQRNTIKLVFPSLCPLKSRGEDFKNGFQIFHFSWILVVPKHSLLKYFTMTFTRHKSSKFEGSGPPLRRKPDWFDSSRVPVVILSVVKLDVCFDLLSYRHTAIFFCTASTPTISGTVKGGVQCHGSPEVPDRIKRHSSNIPWTHECCFEVMCLYVDTGLRNWNGYYY